MIKIADLYSGAGGASCGLRNACHHLGLHYQLTAINHWEVAIATHTANFPGHQHLCTDVEKVKAKEAIPSGRLDLLIAAPSCVHFSTARGGTPVDDQQRSGAWEVIHWCRDLDVQNVLVENVPAFATWGPLRQKKCKLTGELLFDKKTEAPLMEPDPAHKGLYFRQWLRMLRDMGYNVEYRILNAAHFGDATTRRRLFIQARKGRQVTWPKPTHHSPSERHAFPTSKSWVPARDIIDWSLPSQSIYNRKKPLAENTLKRIFAGLEKFGGLTTEGNMALCEPYLVVLRNNCDAQSLDTPVPTICTSTGHFGIATPFLVTPYGPRGQQGERTIEEPLATILGDNHTALVQPYLTKFYGGHDSASLDEPLGAITANYEHYGLCRPYLVRYNGGERSQSLDNPLTTIDTSNRFGLCEPYLVSYYGNGEAISIDAPLDTITTRDRFALISPQIYAEQKDSLKDGQVIGYLDIHFRMLQPHELAAAHSFPEDYQFTGGREERVKQVGNSWPVGMATALCEEIVRDYSTKPEVLR